MGKRGPAPKRSNQRRRANEPATPITHGFGAASVPVPKPNAGWHAMAKRWFVSLGESGQHVWYEPSDWALAEVLAEQMSRHLKEQVIGYEVDEDTGSRTPIMGTVPMKGAELTAILRGMTQLLVSETDRRRAGIELKRPPPETGKGVDNNVAWLVDARRGRQPG